MDLVMWRDFPKGIKVLLLDEDAASAAQTKSKLQAMDYVVSMYCNVKDALEAISMKEESFHVAIIEVAKDHCYGSFKFLEMAKNIPTIAISDVPCMTTTVKCIALGAVEFLQKPLSEDKLRNIWQHVVHKALNVGGEVLSKSLEPVKETVVSMLQLQVEGPVTEINEKDQARDELDILSAPSTPQLIKGGRLIKDDDFLEQINSSFDKESTESSKFTSEVKKICFSESKSVDNSCINLANADRNCKEVVVSEFKKAADQEEVDSNDGPRNLESKVVKEGSRSKSGSNDVKKRKSCSKGNRSGRKKMKVDWAPELHKQFVKAVEELGIDQAIPSKILELMKVEGLTRHNVASHLQKYRMNKRYILPKENNRCKQQVHNDPNLRTCMPRPPTIFPSFPSNYVLPATQMYPVWGHPRYQFTGVPAWGYAGLPTWHPPQGSWHWKTNPAVHADAWGCPVVPPYKQCSGPMQSTAMNNSLDATGDRGMDFEDPYSIYLTDEMIDEVVKEAMSKPWLPLPLGLNPPSTDGVLAELSRQGICSIPPH